MKRFMNKKVAAIGLAAGLVLGAGGAAFAYFTTSATGTGSASTGNAVALTGDIVQNGTTSGLTPGGPSETISYTVTNSANFNQYVGQVNVSITGVTSGLLTGNDVNGNPYETCATSMYSITQGSPLNTDLAPNGQPGDSATGTATITMKDDGGDQDNCQAPNGVVALGFAESA